MCRCFCEQGAAQKEHLKTILEIEAQHGKQLEQHHMEKESLTRQLESGMNNMANDPTEIVRLQTALADANTRRTEEIARVKVQAKEMMIKMKADSATNMATAAEAAEAAKAGLEAELGKEREATASTASAASEAAAAASTALEAELAGARAEAEAASVDKQSAVAESEAAVVRVKEKAKSMMLQLRAENASLMESVEAHKATVAAAQSEAAVKAAALDAACARESYEARAASVARQQVVSLTMAAETRGVSLMVCRGCDHTLHS